jgi:hypothetical protein
MTERLNDRETEWQRDWMTERLNDRETEWQSDWMTERLNDRDWMTERNKEIIVIVTDVSNRDKQRGEETNRERKI